MKFLAYNSEIKLSYIIFLNPHSFQNSWYRNENEQLKNNLSEKTIQVEHVLQQTQQADTQKDLQLNETVAQNTQLQQKVEVLQQQIRTRGNVSVSYKSRNKENSFYAEHFSATVILAFVVLKIRAI